MSDALILTLNAGSSSIKFSLYETSPTNGQEASDQEPLKAAALEPVELAVGQVESLGPEAKLSITHAGEKRRRDIGQANHDVALQAILTEIDPIAAGRPVAGVGHRIVHGGADFAEPRRLDTATLEALEKYIPFAPLHQPHNLAAVTAAWAAFPNAVQIGCFDTAFHRGHPWVNDTFALPRRLYEHGVRRYGFHGLSYQYVSEELARQAPALAQGRVAIAHLGNGASMCGLRAGRSIASSMGFSALDGLPMGTRCGQLDPGVVLFLIAQAGLSVGEVESLLYRESGLKGLSGLSHDMRTLETSDNPQAAEAIDYFVFRVRREIGAMAAALGGLDAIVFCGGIGENSATIRARVCEGMDWLGVTVDPDLNAEHRGDVATPDARVRVLVIATDEERVIARAVNAALR